MTKGAAWVLFIAVVLPAAFTPLLIGGVLLLESDTGGRIVGVLCMAVGLVAVGVSTVIFLRKRPTD